MVPILAHLPLIIKKIFERKCVKIKNEMKRLEESSTAGIYLDDIKVVIAIKNSNKEIEEVLDNFDLIINQLLEYYINSKIGEKKSLSKEVHKHRIENLISNPQN